MSSDDAPPLAPLNVWEALRAFTPARIGLSRSGVSLSAGSVLELRAAHAAARDAVWTHLQTEPLIADLTALISPIVEVDSKADDRRTYLLRPDLGRALSPKSAKDLARLRGAFDLAIVLADGLSPMAIQRHAAPLLALLLPMLDGAWRVAPGIVAKQGRVAIGDEIAMALGSTAVLVLIGERPGLSATDSLGAYLTWGAKPGLTDADRNCVSNIRPDGLGYEDAARQVAYLLEAAKIGGFSGVALKNRGHEALIRED